MADGTNPTTGMPPATTPKRRYGQYHQPPTFMPVGTMDDVQPLLQAIQAGSYVYPLPWLDPVQETFVPLDTGRQEAAIRRLARAQAEGYQGAIEQARGNLRQSRNRTLARLAPTLIQAVSGAPMNTGLEQHLAAEHEARQRALALQQQAAMEVPRLIEGGNLQAEALAAQTAYQNQTGAERVRVANAQRVQDTLKSATGLLSEVMNGRLTYDQAIAAVEQRMDKARLDAATDAEKNRIDMLEGMFQNPGLIQVYRSTLRESYGMDDAEIDAIYALALQGKGMAGLTEMGQADFALSSLADSFFDEGNDAFAANMDYYRRQFVSEYGKLRKKLVQQAQMGGVSPEEQQQINAYDTLYRLMNRPSIKSDPDAARQLMRQAWPLLQQVGVYSGGVTPEQAQMAMKQAGFNPLQQQGSHRAAPALPGMEAAPGMDGLGAALPDTTGVPAGTPAGGDDWVTEMQQLLGGGAGAVDPATAAIYERAGLSPQPQAQAPQPVAPVPNVGQQQMGQYVQQAGQYAQQVAQAAQNAAGQVMAPVNEATAPVREPIAEAREGVMNALGSLRQGIAPVRDAVVEGGREVLGNIRRGVEPVRNAVLGDPTQLQQMAGETAEALGGLVGGASAPAGATSAVQGAGGDRPMPYRAATQPAPTPAAAPGVPPERAAELTEAYQQLGVPPGTRAEVRLMPGPEGSVAVVLDTAQGPGQRLFSPAQFGSYERAQRAAEQYAQAINILTEQLTGQVVGAGDPDVVTELDRLIRGGN